MKKFNITYTEAQEKALKKSGFPGIANDPDGLETLFFILKKLEYLESHNKNYTKAQYNEISELYELFKTINSAL